MSAEKSASAAGSETLRASADVVAQRLGDELVIVHLGTNQIFVLNRTGARFWELLEDGTTLDSVRERLLAEFEVDEDRLAGELENFAALLSKEKLIDVDQRA